MKFTFLMLIVAIMFVAFIYGKPVRETSSSEFFPRHNFNQKHQHSASCFYGKRWPRPTTTPQPQPTTPAPSPTMATATEPPAENSASETSAESTATPSTEQSAEGAASSENALESMES